MTLNNETIQIVGSLKLQFSNGSSIVFSESGVCCNADFQSIDQITNGQGEGLHLDNLTVAVQGANAGMSVNGVAVPAPAS